MRVLLIGQYIKDACVKYPLDGMVTEIQLQQYWFRLSNEEEHWKLFR